MGDKIGDYIHYHINNYIKWGTNHVGESGSSAAMSNSIFQMQKEKIQAANNSFAAMDPSKQKMLADRLSWLMKPPDKNNKAYQGSGTNKEDYDIVWNGLQEFLEKEFHDANLAILRETANIDSNSNIPGLKKITYNKGAAQMQIATIASRIEAIYNALTVAHQANQTLYTPKEISFLEQTMEAILTQTQKITELAEQNWSELAVNHKTIPLTTAVPLIKIINSAAAASTGLMNIKKGRLFEVMIAIAPYIGKLKTKEAVVKKLQEIADVKTGTVAVGGQGSYVNIDVSQFILDINNLKQVYKYGYMIDSINSNLIRTVRPTQDKIDVQFDWKGGNAISAKNVNLSGGNSEGITLVSGLSLLNALYGLQNGELVNHYLNQHLPIQTTTRRQFGTGSAGINYADNALILKLSILAEAFRGYKPGAAQADTFIVNDNVTGQIKIIDISQILNKLMAYPIIDNYVNIDPEISVLRFNNTFASSYEQRIVNLLQDVHSYKLTVKLLGQAMYL